MRICVFGAGAIGGHLAARLVRGGADVSVVARGAHLAAVRDSGLTVQAPDATFTVRVEATDDPAALGPQDAVLVTVKAPALPSVATAIAPLLGPDTPVAFVMNGIPWWYFQRHGGAWDGRRLDRLDPGGSIDESVGIGRVLGGVVYSACTVVRPGVVFAEHARNRLVLGEPGGGESPRAEAIAAPLREAGFRVDVTPRIRDEIWSKLLMNLSTGPLSVLSQSPMHVALQDPACEAAVRACLAEGMRIAVAMGCAPTLDVERQIGVVRTMQHKPSVLQDLELGRKMEIDGLYGVPLELARLSGVETPTLDLLVALVKLRARAAGLYG